ncbi:MAG: ABC transporter substrate-binding protein [bacterium]
MPRHLVPRRLPTVSLVPIALTAVAALTLVACGDPQPLVIGDGMPRGSAPSVDSVARLAIDSGGLRQRIGIAPWKVAPGLGIVRAVDGAVRFAQNESLIGVVGHPGSQESLLAASVYNDRGIPQVVPNATSRRLASVGPWTFTLSPNDSVEGAFLASYAIDALHGQRIAVVYVGDEYGAGLRDGVRSKLVSRGLDLVDATMVPNAGCGGSSLELQRAMILASLRRSRPDVVVLAIGISNSACIAEIINAERPDAWILGGDGFDGEAREIRNLSDSVKQRILSVRLWTPDTDSVNRLFIARFRRIVGREPSVPEALGYDGFALLAAAAREGGGTRAGVRRWLESLGHSRRAFPGVTGPISFDHGRVGAQMRMAPIDGPLP